MGIEVQVRARPRQAYKKPLARGLLRVDFTLHSVKSHFPMTDIPLDGLDRVWTVEMSELFAGVVEKGHGYRTESRPIKV